MTGSIRFVALASLLFPASAFAQTADGTCSTESPNGALASLADGVQSATMSQWRGDVTICDPPRFVLDADLENPTTSFTIPLKGMDPRPLSIGELAKKINQVRIPRPWGDNASATFKIEGEGDDARVVVSTPVFEPGTWVRTHPAVILQLDDGRSMYSELSFPTVIRDDRANRRFNIESSIATELAWVAEAEAAKKTNSDRVAHAELLPSGLEGSIALVRSSLAEVEAALAARPSEQLAASRQGIVHELKTYTEADAWERTNRVEGLKAWLQDIDPRIAEMQGRIAANRVRLDNLANPENFMIIPTTHGAKCP